MPDENGNPTMADASAGLAAALESSEQAPAVMETPEVTPTTAPPAETPATETVYTPPSLDGIDFTQPLTEADIQKIQNGFLRQQDYTQKTQQVAPLRSFLDEAGADLADVRQSYEFVQRLQNDPEFLAQVASEMQEYVPGKVTPQTAETTTVEPIEVPVGADPVLARQVADLNAWRQEQESARENAKIVAQWEEKLTSAEQAIRESNPSYSEEDIATIYDIAPKHEWDMFAAQTQFESLRNRIINEALGGKLNHPAAANPVGSGTLATQPQEVRSFEDAARATRERMRQSE